MGSYSFGGERLRFNDSESFIEDLAGWIDLQIEEDVDGENGWVEIGEKLEEYLRTINPDEIDPNDFSQICDSLGGIVDACNF
jgi:hypothetical protein